MARGTVRLSHPGESRNAHQSVTLLEAIEEFACDALVGGARHDEEKARAKERIFSHTEARQLGAMILVDTASNATAGAVLVH